MAWQTRLEQGSFVQDRVLADARNFFEHHDKEKEWGAGIEENKRSRFTSRVSHEALVKNARTLLTDVDSQVEEELTAKSLTDEHERQVSRGGRALARL